MLLRVLPICLAVAAFVLLCGQVVAEDKDNAHEGKVVSVAGNKLVMTDDAGKEHSHTVAEKAKISCDGKACLLSDLKPGTKIKVFTKKGDATKALRIEAKTK
jgi:hypothetical protein